MDPITLSNSEQESECSDKVQMRHDSKEVTFYLRDSTATDEGKDDSGTDEISDDISEKPQERQGDVDDDLWKQYIKASIKQKELRYSAEQSFVISKRTSSEGTLTSFSSSSASTIDRPSSDEIQRKSVLSPFPSLTNFSSNTTIPLQDGNSEVDAFVEESCESVSSLSLEYADKDSRKYSEENTSGLSSASMSSSRLNTTNSKTSFSDEEKDNNKLDAERIRRNFQNIIEEIDPVFVLDLMYNERNIESEIMLSIQELPTRRERAIETILFVLTKDDDNCCSTFYRICCDTYEHVFKSFDQENPSTSVSTYFCKLCSTKISDWILEFLHGIQSQISTEVCINTLLYRLMEVDLVSPKAVVSVHRKTYHDKINLMMDVMYGISQENGYPKIGDFLWALLSNDVIKSKDSLTKEVNILETRACRVCREVVYRMVNELDENEVMMESFKFETEETRTTVLYYDLSSFKEVEKIVFLKLKTKDDMKVKEILSKKMLLLNKRIEGIARIDDVIVGSLILKLAFKDTGTTDDTHRRIEKVLQTVFSDQEIRGYLDTVDMEISVSVSDKTTDVDDVNVMNQKLTIILNMTTLLEELDAINFKQKFVDKRLMSNEHDFECQFRVRELGRRARTSLLLRYVLSNEANVMDVFLEVIKEMYSFLEETLLKKMFINCDQTERKNYAPTEKVPVENTEMEGKISGVLDFGIDSLSSPVSSLGIMNKTKQYEENLNSCSKFDAKNKNDKNNNVQKSDACTHPKWSTPYSSSQRPTNPSSHFSSDCISSGPREMLFDPNNQNPNSKPLSDLVARRPDNLFNGFSAEQNAETNNNTPLHFRGGTKHVQVPTTDVDRNKTVHSTNVKSVNALNGFNLEIVTTLSFPIKDGQTE